MELAINVRNWGPTATVKFIHDSVLIADKSMNRKVTPKCIR